MDPATLIGVLVGLVIIVVGNVMEGGNPMSLLLVPPMLLVFGTTLMVTTVDTMTELTIPFQKCTSCRASALLKLLRNSPPGNHVGDGLFSASSDRLAMMSTKYSG